MNKLLLKCLALIKKSHKWISHSPEPRLAVDCQGQAASDRIRDMLLSDKSCLITRFGSIELDTVVNYISICSGANILRKIFDYIADKKAGFWWEEDIKKQMQNNAGFFPPTEPNLIKFAELMLKCMTEVDMLGSWRAREVMFAKQLKNAVIIPLADLEPYYHRQPWTTALANKKVLVVHPFSASIEKQYQKREHLFANKDVLPEFQLQTITAVQSSAGCKSKYADWFEALKDMQSQIVQKDFDIALIGCGAYGLPLAAFVKEQGKKAVHLGGVTQLLFGIKGRRWDAYTYVRDSLYNKYWMRPSSAETPAGYGSVEKGCYW